MKRPSLKEQEESYKSSLNDFMKEFGIGEISFGSHSLKKTKGKKAKSISKKKK